MATTTNFGWETPDDTDLVKDGAAAMRTLGNAIDTSLVDLKGGTTGQILSKASNTDLDYTWINNDQGDITGVTAGTGLTGGGTSGAVTLNFDIANYGGGEKAAGKNKIINGNFDIWQRGTSTAAIAYGTYLADRWRIVNNGTGQNTTYSRDTSVPNSQSLYSAKVQQLTSNATSVTEYALHQIFEVGTVFNLAGKTATVSFWYRSNKTGNHYARLYTSNATGGTDVTTAFTVSAANTWEYKTISFSSYAAVTAFTGALTDNGGGLQIGINTYAGASAMTIAANDYFQVAQVQVEAGSTATLFQTATGTIQGELAACQRYYQQFGGGLSGNWDNTTTAIFFAQYPVQMRVAPTLALLTTSPVVGVQGGSDLTGSGSAIAFSSIGKSGFRVGVNGFTGATQYRSNWVSTQSTDILSGSAEL